MFRSFARISVMMLSVIPSVFLEASASEPALAVAHTQAELQWGPCPPFIPEGCRIAVLNGDPSKPNADVFFKVPSGTSIPSHWHTSAERMVLVAGEMRVTYEGQAPVTLESGMYAYGPPRRPHSATCAPGDDCVLFIAFEEPIDAFAIEQAEGAKP